VPQYVPLRSTFTKAERIAPVWTLEKDGRQADCSLWSHVLGYELRLSVSDDPLPRTRVCKDTKELVTVQDEWRQSLESRGWTKS
jgi:hypothetical protein